MVATSGVPAKRIDLIPPVGGGMGLPYTIAWADSYADTGGSGAEERVLLDPDLWSDRHVTVSGTGTTPKPTVGAAVSGSVAPNPTLADQLTVDPNMVGLTMNLSAPRLNYELGQMELGQIVQHPSRSLYLATELRSSFPAAKRTISEVGRYTAHPKRRYSSARPANYTWVQSPAVPDKASLMTAADQAIGAVGVSDAIGASTHASWTGGTRVEGIMHHAASDLPSNGFGLSYGDAHNSVFVIGLGSAPLQSTQTEAATGLNMGLTGGWSGGLDSQVWSENWSVNLMVRQPTLVSGTTLNSPDGCPTAVSAAAEDDEISSTETIQTIAVRDIASDAATTQTEAVHPLGRPDLGNHAIMDSAGLIGYEGVVSASAFFSVSRHANKSGGGGSESYPIATDGSTYAGINIQVHSGATIRRNKMTVPVGASVFKYGTDGVGTAPMTNALKTSGVRGASYSTNDGNVSCFWTDRTPTTPIEVVKSDKSAVNRILGDSHDPATKWNSTTTLTTRFAADMIPTKVRVVPVLLGYTDVVVPAGASKLITHPTAVAQTFRKPIVDYHILVSMAKPSDWNATTNLLNTEVGIATTRNDPQPNRLVVNTDLSQEPCFIYHAIVRLDPTLEQVFFDAADPDAAAAGLTLTEAICENSVMPRHDAGWGLHQVTPFRPIANVNWNRVPKLCGAIEAGGFYQRGGISHLWDADGFNGELFVGADAIDSTDFSTETVKDGDPFFDEFGNGQIWPDGANIPQLPPGPELLIFRYTPHNDPYHPVKKATTPTDNPLRDAMVAETTAHDYISGTYNSTLDDAGFTITDDRLLHFRGWEIHEWVFPQLELMRYLGREDKGRAEHPAHSSPSGNPLNHPTLHCSSLRIMEDGRMLMAAIHRDYILNADDYPSVDIRYPYNPDLELGGCPPGFYESDGQCLPIANTTDSIPEGSHYDPITGTIVPTPPPFPTGGTSANHVGGTDNFSLWPTWSKLIANTSARSLVLLWSDAKADAEQVKRSRSTFDLDWVRVGDGTAAGQKLARQAWNQDGVWWSGARIAYWYAESGQRAIPLTYGSYPECRCSLAVLPKSLPHLIGTGASLLHGFPLSMMADRVSASPAGRDGTTRLSLDSWMTDRRDFLKLTRFVPTTIGMSDFGAGGNPHQELGWSGAMFPTGLYDPIAYDSATKFFTDDPSSPTYQNQWSGFGHALGMLGPFGGWSHHGPLHYGVSTLHHPYRTDRVWKQVHGGVGYDLPLHYLIPSGVQVRARAGGSNSLDLELELPFGRTETRVVEGAELFNAGFELGGASPPAVARGSIGQFNLNTNLWDTGRTHASGALLAGLGSYQRVKGPVVSGNDLTAFWTDHPTDHFHAGAMPIHPNTDYDLALIESERYSPAMLARRDETHPLDVVAVAEQLQSSVEVHVSQATKPYWDSGSIVTAQGVGLISDDAKSGFAASNRSEMDGDTVRTPAQLSVNYDNGLGKGQRVVRTPDGTLHTFSLQRSGQASSTNYPIWTHFKKPLFGDLFFNSKALKTTPATATYDGKDECGPLLASLFSTGTNGRVLGASFASDSHGTIHAVIEVMADKDNTGGERAHRLYYTKADRISAASSPSPVYDWDWTLHTPQLINSDLSASPTPAAANGYDLRQPTLVCDEKDTLHLAFVQINASTSVVFYMSKLADEGEFPSFAATTLTDTRIQQVSKTMTDTNDPAMNAPSVGPHATQYADNPKLTLRGDSIPVCFYRGASPDFVTTDRRESAVYVNLGEIASSTNEPTGRSVFDTEKAHHALGLGPDLHNSLSASDAVIFYDGIVDELNRAFIVAIKKDNQRHTLLSSFDTNKDLDESYTSTEGLGTIRTLFIDDNTGSRDVRSHRADVTITTNGKGELHLVFSFTLRGDDPDRVPAVFRDTALTTEAGIGPLTWPAQPASDLTTGSTSPPTIGDAYEGGYAQPAGFFEWPDGGLTPPPTGTHEDEGSVIKHLMEVWIPSHEFDQDAAASHWVIRSTNIRWLSVPSLGYDATVGWYPVGSAATLAGTEDFVHFAPQLRYQRFWGYDASELDLKWATNEMSWFRTPHAQSRVLWPSEGGATMLPAGGGGAAEGIPAWPSGV